MISNVGARIIFLCGCWAIIGQGQLFAQTTPRPSGESSILESASDAEDSLPAPTPQTVPAPERPSESGSTVEREPPATEVDPFADLFLDLPLDVSQQPRTPDELEQPPVVEIQDAALPIPTEKALQLPQLATRLGYAVLLAGPVHEGLLARFELPEQQAPATAVPLPPPPAVNEQAPQPSATVPRFVGNDVQWIGGYWAWLAETQNYVWVSGMYRDVPPGRKWRPGSWAQTPAGYQWISGYWAELDSVALAAGPRAAGPPPAQETEPSQSPPSEDSFWIPGEWLVAKSGDQATAAQTVAEETTADYRWRAGYWATRADQWIWQPTQYVGTAAGYVSVSGYWDYEPHFRGQAYATVVFDDANDRSSPLAFRPVYPLCRPASVLLHLFFKPHSRHYFYGDFYDNRYAELGYQPWYQAEVSGSSSTTWESPLLSFYEWKYRRQGVDFVSSMSRFAQHFRSAPSIRPAAQLAAAPRLADRDGLSGVVNATTFDSIVRGSVGGQPAVWLAEARRDRSTTKSNSDASTAAAFFPNISEGNSPAVTTASASERLQPDQFNAPRGAAPLSLPGTSGLMVLPGGRVIVAPARQ